MFYLLGGHKILGDAWNKDRVNSLLSSLWNTWNVYQEITTELNTIITQFRNFQQLSEEKQLSSSDRKQIEQLIARLIELKEKELKNNIHPVDNKIESTREQMFNFKINIFEGDYKSKKIQDSVVFKSDV